MRKYRGKWSKVLKRVNKMMIEGKEMHDTRTRAKTVCLKLDQTNSSGVTVMLKNDFYWEFVWFIYVISHSFYVPGWGWLGRGPQLVLRRFESSPWLHKAERTNYSTFEPSLSNAHM